MLTGETNTVVICAHHGTAIQAEQRVFQSKGLADSDLLLGVLDLVKAAAVDQVAMLPAIRLSIAPVALSLDVVDLMACREFVADIPVGHQPGNLVVVANLGVIDVVVVPAQALAILAINQRRTEVAHKILIAIVVG